MTALDTATAQGIIIVLTLGTQPVCELIADEMSDRWEDQSLGVDVVNPTMPNSWCVLLLTRPVPDPETRRLLKMDAVRLRPIMEERHARIESEEGRGHSDR